MGIKRLSQFLRDEFSTVNVSVLAGQTIGIDTSSWVYQLYFCQFDTIADPAILILRNIELRLKLFEKHKITVSLPAGLRFRRPQTALQSLYCR
jgi:hypothetical protein